MKNTRRGAAVLVALLVLISGIGAMGAMGAAPSEDNETTETSQTTDLSEGGSQQYNATTSSNFSWTADSNNSSITITQNGTVIYTAEPTAYHTNTTSGTSYYNRSLADDGSDYGAIEVGANENASLDAELVNDTSLSSPDNNSINYTFVNGEERAFIAGTAGDTKVEKNESGFLASASTLGGLLGNDSDPGAAKVTDSTNVTSNTSEIVVDVAQADAADSLSHVADESDGLTMMGYAKVDGTLAPMFVGSADADWLDKSNETYVVVNSAGDSATIYNPGASSATSMDVELHANDDLGWDSVGMLRDYGAGWTTAISQGSLIDGDRTPDYEAAA